MWSVLVVDKQSHVTFIFVSVTDPQDFSVCWYTKSSRIPFCLKEFCENEMDAKLNRICG